MNASALGIKSSLDVGDNILSNDDKIQTNDIDFKEFLSSILLNIKSSSDTNKKTLLDTNILTSKHNKVVDQIDTKKDYHSISVDELLQFVLHLKSNSLKGNFPTDKKKLNEILHNKQAINEFKNIKNIKELFEVAKKYDIKITKFDISFEEDKDDNIASLKDIQKYLSKTKTGSAAKEQISSETILHLSKIKSIKSIKTKDNTGHTLKNILNSTKTAIKTKDSISQEKIVPPEKIAEQKYTKVEKEPLEKARQKSTLQENIQIKPIDAKPITKAVLEEDGKIIYQADKKDNLYQEKVQHSKKQSIKIEDNKDNKLHITRKNDIKIISKSDIKEGFEQEKRVLSDKKAVEQKHTKVEKESLEKVRQKSTLQENIQIKPIDAKPITKAVLEEDGKIIYQADKKDNLYQEKVQHSKKQSIKIEDNKDNKLHITRKNDIKIISKSDIKEGFEQEKRVLSDKKAVEQKHTKVEKESLENIKQKSTIQKNKTNPIENKSISNSFPNQFHTDKTKTVSNKLSKHLNLKLTLEQFVNDLKNEIQDYKPPLTRVKMTLNPKDLGSVDVSIISRGNNLQININANSNTLAIFTQNQAEFKNALVNMGFTNLNMNFNSNSNSQNKQQNKNSNKESLNFEELSENEVERVQTISLSIPRYI